MLMLNRKSRRPMLPLVVGGATLLSLGFVSSLGALLDPMTRVEALHRLSVTLMVIGAVLLTYAGLRSRGRDVEEAYRLGYDVGFENGHRAGLASAAEDAASCSSHSMGKCPVVGPVGPEIADVVDLRLLKHRG